MTAQLTRAARQLIVCAIAIALVMAASAHLRGDAAPRACFTTAVAAGLQPCGPSGGLKPAGYDSTELEHVPGHAVHQDAAAGQAEISGTVVTTNVPATPLARVLVTISGSPLKPSRTIITDDQGAFVFRSLPTGSFTIMAVRPPYVKTSYGAKRPGGQGTPISVAAGQRITGVTIPMARGAAITGLVRNPGGEPAPGMQIVATSADAQPDPLALPIVTDDRGVYRVFGLPPGKYIVSAKVSDFSSKKISQVSDAEMDQILARLQQRSATAGTTGSSASGPRPSAGPAVVQTSARPPTYDFAPVYHPGTTDPDQAEAIALAEGEEHTGVDLTLQLVRNSTIDGRVSSANGALPSGTQVTLTRAGSIGRASNTFNAYTSAPIDAAGHFQFTNVMPGKYRVLARAMAMAPVVSTTSASGVTSVSPAAFANASWALADVTIADDDVLGLALMLQPGLRLSGRIAFDAHTLKPPATVQLRFMDMSGAASFTTFSGNRPDGTFEISGILPGTYGITSVISDAGWWLRSVIVGGRDVLDVPLEIGASGDVSGAVATFTDQHTELSGTLQSAGNTPAPDHFVVVLAEDRAFWRLASRRVQFTRPSTDGHFSLRDLPAGDYLIAALTDLNPADLNDASFLERLIPAAVKVHLNDGEKKTQDLRLVK